MFAIIKDNKIIWFSDTKITNKNMKFDKLIEWNFDIQKNYIFENWNIIESTNYNSIDSIKQKYQELIFSKYSLTAQLNMSNEAVQITAFAQFEKRDFTEIEINRLLEIQEAKKWIDEQRQLCQNEILNLNI